MIFPKISIITPSYNQGKFIERTIKSVLDQNYPNLEYFVIDGGSTDETIDILKKYEDRLTWISEPDRGQAHAINKGLKMSGGDVLAYLNSDDTYEANTFKIVSKYFLKHPKASFLYGEGRLINKNDEEIDFYQTKKAEGDELQRHCPISQPSAFWKKDVYKKIGKFDEDFQFTMDYEYWIRVSKYFKLSYLKDLVLSNTRIHQDAKTSAFNSKLHLEAIKTVKKHYKKVHYDWIFNYINSLYSFKKNTIFYYLSLIIGSFFLNLFWNKKLPNKIMVKQYVNWLKEYINHEKK